MTTYYLHSNQNKAVKIETELPLKEFEGEYAPAFMAMQVVKDAPSADFSEPNFDIQTGKWFDDSVGAQKALAEQAQTDAQKAVQETAQVKEKVAGVINGLDDETALQVAELYPEWQADKTYTAKTIVRYQEKLYRVVSDHSSQADWLPDATPALYSLISLNTDGSVNWIQPLGAHDAYKKGDQVVYNGKTFESLVDGNVWEPVEGAQWKEVKPD